MQTKITSTIKKTSLGILAGAAVTFAAGNAQANNLFGIDVSHYQGSINFSSVKSCGANYVFAKATEGTTYTDPNFGTYMSNGKGAGLQMGASWLNNKVEGIPVLQNVVQPFGDIVGGAGASVADVFNGIGESFDDTGAAFEKLCHGDLKGFAEGLGDAASDVVGGAADAVEDAASSVKDAVVDFFSGW